VLYTNNTIRNDSEEVDVNVVDIRRNHPGTSGCSSALLSMTFRFFLGSVEVIKERSSRYEITAGSGKIEMVSEEQKTMHYEWLCGWRHV
jgi:hypothetical protein